MWADAFADVALPQTTSSLPEVVKDVELEIGETPLNLEMGVKYILQYDFPASLFISFGSVRHISLASNFAPLD